MCVLTAQISTRRQPRRNSKISNLNCAILTQENVSGLNVSVKCNKIKPIFGGVIVHVKQIPVNLAIVVEVF